MKYYDLPDTYSNCSKCHKRKTDDDLCHECGGCETCCNCPPNIPDDGLAILFFDAVGVCKSCGLIGSVNGWQFCEWCMGEFED